MPQQSTSRLARSLLFQLASTGAIAIISFAVTILFGRVMGPAEFGSYNFLLSLASLFFIFQDGGYRAIIYRENTLPTFSQAIAKKAFSYGSGHLLLASGLELSVLLLPGVSSATKWAMAAAILCFAFVAYAGFISAEFQARGQFGYDAVWQTGARISSAALMAITVLFLSSTPAALFLAWAFGIALCLIIHFFINRQFSFPRVWRSPFFRSSLSLIVVGTSTTLYHRLDVIMLKFLDNPTGVGVYAASYRFLDGLILLTTPLSVVLFRRIRKFKGNPAALRKTIVRYSSLGFMIALVLLVLVAVAHNRIIQYSYGSEYEASSSLLPILFSALLFIFPNSILSQAAIASNKERGYAFVALVSAGANAVLNFIFIPLYGPTGAAWTTMATEAILTMLLLALAVKGLGNPDG